ncbi:MAG: hypothetical protein J6W27_02525 [Alphaproteobacteria bacterium]|nr:hypothetical protein [Alphaproteobacteria bacterium]
MRFNLKTLFVLSCFACLLPFVASAVDLSAVVTVNQTSDTATKAKSEAINDARRQVLFKVLSKYADPDALTESLKNTSDDDLVNFIVSTSVANEHISSTGYSANITMDIDGGAVKQWLGQNNVQNWIPNTEVAEKFSMYISLSNGLNDWAELKRIAREMKTEIETVVMSGNQILAKMPLNQRSKFTVLVRSAGWKYSDNDGILHIWK